jgi:hypothetical protein
MGIGLSKPLIVPEYQNALVKLYVPDPVTSAPTLKPDYTIDLQGVLTALIPGRIARVNACALRGDDLFVANSSFFGVNSTLNSQCVFRVPTYLRAPGPAIASAYVFTLAGNDYVGMAFDAAGILYAAEGEILDNRIVRYTGAAGNSPEPSRAAVSNYDSRLDVGNAGATSYFANLVFDAAGNLWASDYWNHRLVVFDAANLGGTSTYHVLANLDASIPVANVNASLKGNIAHLFAEPEGIDFDGAGNLWVANNNDGGAGGVQNSRTSLVKITPQLQNAVLATAAGTALTPTIVQSSTDFFIYQVPNLADDAGARPQFGGLQVDRTAGRIFVNEEVAGNGRGYDIASIVGIGTATATNDLDIISTNPGNGGIVLVNTPFP